MASQRDSSGRAKDPFSTVGSFVAEERPALRHAGQFQPGDLVAGRFEVVRYIAHGGMGEVYEVADRHLHGVRLALKTILPQAGSRKERKSASSARSCWRAGWFTAIFVPSMTSFMRSSRVLRCCF